MATPAVAIQKLPPGPERAELRFQEHLTGPLHLPVSAEFHGGDEWSSPGLSFGDYASMSQHTRKLAKCRRLENPSWSMNDEQLREVVAAYVEARAQGHARVCVATAWERIASAQKLLNVQAQAKRATLVRLCQEYVALKQRRELSEDEQKRKRLLAIEIENTDTQLRVDAKIATVVTAVAYAYYRRGLDSVAIAGELGLKPPHVRVILFRLNKVAYRLTKERPAAIPMKRGRKRLTVVPTQPRDCGQKHPVRLSTIERHVRRLEEVAEQHAGMLPPYEWLNKNGYFRSYEVMRKNPGAFAHLERKFLRTPNRTR